MENGKKEAKNERLSRLCHLMLIRVLINEFSGDNLVPDVKVTISCLIRIDQRMRLTTPIMKFV